MKNPHFEIPITVNEPVKSMPSMDGRESYHREVEAQKVAANRAASFSKKQEPRVNNENVNTVNKTNAMRIRDKPVNNMRQQSRAKVFEIPTESSKSQDKKSATEMQIAGKSQVSLKKLISSITLNKKLH